MFTLRLLCSYAPRVVSVHAFPARRCSTCCIGTHYPQHDVGQIIIARRSDFSFNISTPREVGTAIRAPPGASSNQSRSEPVTDRSAEPQSPAEDTTPEEPRPKPILKSAMKSATKKPPSSSEENKDEAKKRATIIRWSDLEGERIATQHLTEYVQESIFLQYQGRCAARFALSLCFLRRGLSRGCGEWILFVPDVYYLLLQ